MKKKIILLITALVIGVTIVSGVYIYNELNYEKCYVKVSENGEKDDRAPSKDFYGYDVTGYNKEGKEIPVYFWSKKELKRDSYIMVDVFKPLNKKSNDVKSYEEIESAKLPKKVKNKLDSK